MKITEWLGWNDEASSYLLRRGELRELINLQPTRRGLLVTRAGMLKTYGNHDEEAVMGMYRKVTPFGVPDVLIVLQRAILESEDSDVPDQQIWRVSRLTSNPFQSQVIDEQPISPNGLSDITNMSVAEDRHGRVFIFYGHGAKPVMYRPTLLGASTGESGLINSLGINSLGNIVLSSGPVSTTVTEVGRLGGLGVEMGLPAPTVAAVVLPEGEGYYIERVDIDAGGGAYWGPPTVTVDGGNPSRPAVLKSLVESGSVVAIDVVDGGADYKTPPKIIVSKDKMGTGFRGIGLLETDPGVQGFVETASGIIAPARACLDDETFGINSLLDENEILYMSSPTVLTTTTQPSASTSTNLLTVGSVAGVRIGDLVSVRSASVAPAPFSDATAVVRVLAISNATASAPVVTLSKNWSPTAGVLYQVLFRRDPAWSSVPAVFDPEANRFTASVPLNTVTGVGQGAESTIVFSPKAEGYSLGAFQQAGFTVPTGGPTASNFAFKEVDWDNYDAFNPGDYYKGEFLTVGDANSPPKGNLRQYTGLQASGKQFVYGYTGAITKAGGRRGDVYFPDYSELSVWLCTGQFQNNIKNWKRADAPVFNGNTSAPYVEIELQPTLYGVGEPATRRRRRPVPQNRPGFSSPKQRGRQRPVAYEKTEAFRPPKIRINLKPCPDSWITNYPTGSMGGDYNLVNWLKNGQANKIEWWNPAETTPRPLVDFRGATGRLDFDTVQIVDPGAGWEKGATFALRIYQANPYDQINDTNYKTRPVATPTTGGRRNRRRSHKAFSTTKRYCEFLFKATRPDDQQPAGPPADIAEPPVVDVAGENYRNGDVAEVLLAKRKTDDDIDAVYQSFLGVLYATGQATEFTYSTSTITGTYSRPSNSNVLTVTTSTAHGLAIGDAVGLDFTSGNAQDGDYVIEAVPTATTFRITHRFSSGSVASTGNVSVLLTANPRQIPGAEIGIDGLSVATVQRITTRSLVRCRTPGVLLDSSQILQVIPGATPPRIFIDKMLHPTPGLTQAVGCDIANVNQVINGQAATRLDNVALTVGGENVLPLLVPGQKLTLALGTREIIRVDIAEIPGSPTPATTATVWVSGSASSALSGTSFRFIFDFEVLSGVTQSQRIRWTASSISAGDSTQKVTSIRVLNSGKNYFAPPAVEFKGGGQGYGLSVKAEVADGKVSSLQITDPGAGWTVPPEVFTPSGGASGSPVMRPALRGKYRCAYRFADRSETVVATTRIIGVTGDDPTKVTVDSASGIKPGMVFDSPSVPFATRVESVADNEVTLSAAATGSGPLSRVVVETGGSGYVQGEAVTVALPTTKPEGWVGDWPAPNATFSAFLGETEPGVFVVRGAAITSLGISPSVYPPVKVPLVFSRPAGGGAAATGYACLTQINNAGSGSLAVAIRDMTKPVSYSDFSPITDVDAGPNEDREHASRMAWSLSGVNPPARADVVEFYRTSADQSLVYYRLEMYGVPTEDGIEIVGEDTLADEDLFDFERPNYAAVPIVLPNGNLNAYRFGQPRTDMSACVAFQDRLWHGVSTSGEKDNSIFYSEYDEFESNPDLNELPIQNNHRSTDSLTALAPFGSMLLAMQTSHTYAVTYNTDPGIDASIQMMSHRGCLNQRCWDIHENILYAADESGIYALSRNGEVNELSRPIRDYFTRELLDFSKRETFHLKVCERTNVLRFFCCLASQPTSTPSVAFCYHISQQTWWSEQYPNSVCSAVSSRPSPTRVSATTYGAADGNIYELAGDRDASYRSIVRAHVTNQGRGYVDAPRITARNGQGAILRGVVSEGRLVDVLVIAGGWGYFQRPAVLTEDGGRVVTEDGFRLVYGAEIPLDLDIEPPPQAGYSLTTEGGSNLVTEAGGRLRQGDEAPASGVAITATPTEVTVTSDLTINLNTVVLSEANSLIAPGMEVFGAHIPEGCRVRSVNGTLLMLEFEDGTPAPALATIQGTPLRFYRAYQTNIPYLLRTGNLEIANDANIPRGGDRLLDRSITLLYSPTQSTKYLELLEYYNDSATARANVHRRNRGGPGGFEHRQDGASTILNLAKDASHLASATGLARATFAGRANSDTTGGDRHLSVEIYGRPSPANGDPGDPAPQRLTLHSMVIDGVLENAE